MFFRMVVLLAAIEPSLLPVLGSSLIVTGVVLLGLALRQWRRRTELPERADALEAMAPFDLGTALAFGALLAAMSVLVPAAKQWLDTSGLYVLSAVAGLADVDAILISLSRLHGTGGVSVAVTVTAISLATLGNMVVKVCIAWAAGHAQIGRSVLFSYLIALASGALVLVIVVSKGV